MGIAVTDEGHTTGKTLSVRLGASDDLPSRVSLALDSKITCLPIVQLFCAIGSLNFGRAPALQLLLPLLSE